MGFVGGPWGMPRSEQHTCWRHPGTISLTTMRVHASYVVALTGSEKSCTVRVGGHQQEPGNDACPGEDHEGANETHHC